MMHRIWKYAKAHVIRAWAFVARGKPQSTPTRAEQIAALSAFMMQGLIDLDQRRRVLAAEDQVLNQMLMELEIAAIRGSRHIQDRWFREGDE